MDKIKEMEEYATQYDIPIMQKEGIEFLCNYIKEQNIKHILEIGSAIAYSSISMAMVDPDIHVVTIERDNDRYEKAVQNIQDAGLTKRIEIRHEDALEASISGEYDLIFIDAAKAQYIRFFEKYEPFLTRNGCIITDNLDFHGFVKHPETIKSRNLRQLVRKIKTYIDYLQNRSDYETAFYDIGDGITISRKKIQKT